VQVTHGCASNDCLEFTQSEADCESHVTKSAHCGCQEMEQIRCLPGLSHVTYGWMPHGCRRSFLEVWYTDSSCDDQYSPESEGATVGSFVSRTAVGKSGTAAKGCVPPTRCNKWPFHSSLTLICDSRPSHTVARVKAMKNKRKLDKNTCAKSKHVGSEYKESV